MVEIEKLLQDIEKLRTDLFRVIEEKQFDLQDPDVQAASRIVNAAIVKYNEFIKDKMEEL